MRWLIVFLLGLASIAQTSEAKACSCMRLTPAEGLSSSQAVFTGEAVAIEKNEATRFGGLEITLRVGEVWKGAIEEQVKVHTAASSAACGYTFVIGTKYLVYAFSNETDPMRVSLCSRTAPLENAKEDLDFLGKPSHRYDEVGKKGAKATGESKDRCSASALGDGASSNGWLMLLLMGVAITMRRIV
jgi:hypothetical protein